MILQNLIDADNPYNVWVNADPLAKKRIAAKFGVDVQDVLLLVPTLKYATSVTIPDPVNELEYE